MLKIWGRINSVNVKKALWAIEELEAPYERIDAGMAFGINKTPEYLKMNPMGLVPVIDDDGFILWESHAIARYLAAKHGKGSLGPTDPRTHADADRWMDWASTFAAGLRNAFWGLIRTPAEKRDQKAIDEALEALGRTRRASSTARWPARTTSLARPSRWATSRSAATCRSG